MFTRLQITDAIYVAMGIKSDSTVFDRNTVVIPKFNSYLSNIAEGQITNILDKQQTFNIPLIEQLSRSVFFYNPIFTTLNADVNIGDIVLYLDTTNYLSSGTVMINENIITYTGKTPTMLTGCSGVAMKHLSGDMVAQLHNMPSNLYKNYKLTDARNPDVEGINFIDDRDPKFGTYFTLKVAADGSAQYLYSNQQDMYCKLNYYKTADALTDDVTPCEFPDKWINEVIIPVVAGDLLVGKYSDDPVLGPRGKGALNNAYSAISTVYGQYMEKTKNHRKKVQRRPWNAI